MTKLDKAYLKDEKQKLCSRHQSLKCDDRKMGNENISKKYIFESGKKPNHGLEFKFSNIHINSEECLSYILGKINIKGITMLTKENKLFQVRNYNIDTKSQAFFLLLNLEIGVNFQIFGP